MTEKNRNWWIGMSFLATGTLLLSLALLVIASMLFPAPATGDAWHRAGFVLKVQLKSGLVGSAVHIGNGFVLTAWHVVKDEQAMTVVTDDGTEHQAEVLWTNEPYDIGLMRLPASAAVGAADLSCRPLQIREPVEAHGMPHKIDFATAWGRVASKPMPGAPYWREVVAVHGVGDSAGMSGGPVLDDIGKLVAIYVGQVPNRPYAFVVPATVICDLLAR